MQQDTVEQTFVHVRNTLARECTAALNAGREDEARRCAQLSEIVADMVKAAQPNMAHTHRAELLAVVKGIPDRIG